MVDDRTPYIEVYVTGGTSDRAAGGLSYIEQVHAVCEAPRRPFLRGVNESEHRALFFKPRCKSWSCPVCGQINKALWTARAFTGAEHLQLSNNCLDFLTITSHEKLDHAASIAIWPHAWKNLSMRARRASGGFEYLMVPEMHQDGRLHVHAIETANLGERWWKDNARACGLGFMAEEEETRSPAGTAAYAAKYLGKGLAVADWPKNFRRVRTSQGWPKLPALDPVPGWSWGVLDKHERLDFAIEKLQHQGYEVTVLDHLTAWDHAKENTP